MSRSAASPDEPDATASLDERPSKTRRKAAMHDLQDLGAALVAIDPVHLAAIALPERLADAIREARGTRTHEGRRRQFQYVGRLMRDVDPEPIRDALARLAQGKPTDQAEVTAAEHWRSALLDEDAALDRLAVEYPEADRSAIAALVRQARDERRRGGPPHRYRELFRRLKALLVARAAGAIAATESP